MIGYDYSFDFFTTNQYIDPKFENNLLISFDKVLPKGLISYKFKYDKGKLIKCIQIDVNINEEIVYEYSYSDNICQIKSITYDIIDDTIKERCSNNNYSFEFDKYKVLKIFDKNYEEIREFDYDKNGNLIKQSIKGKLINGYNEYEIKDNETLSTKYYHDDFISRTIIKYEDDKIQEVIVERANSNSLSKENYENNSVKRISKEREEYIYKYTINGVKIYKLKNDVKYVHI